MTFLWRGLVEGFYGEPWSHSDRLWTLERMGRFGMNLYVYAPKDDPFHLERWREPYPDEKLAEFRELVDAGERAGVGIAFAVSPGRSMVYADREDLAKLVAKYRQLAGCGAAGFALALDDVPTTLQHDADRAAFGSLGEAHAALARALLEALPDVFWWLVPTDYVGLESTPDLEVLAGLPPEIEIAWTGRTVVSPEIRADEAAARAKALRRPPLIWDNVPVNDGPMRVVLHLGPYRGRDPELAAHARGILLNPMEHAHASALALQTAGEYLLDPAGYDPEAAWARAIDDLAGGLHADALERFARAHRFSPSAPDDRDRELEAALAELRAAPPLGAALARAAALVEARLDAVSQLAGLADAKLAAELAPWLESSARELRCMQRALRVLASLENPAHTRMARVLTFSAAEGGLNLDPPRAHAAYGPRRVAYPQFVSMREDQMRYGLDPYLFVDRCLTDELIRLAETRVHEQLG